MGHTHSGWLSESELTNAAEVVKDHFLDRLDLRDISLIV